MPARSHGVRPSLSYIMRTISLFLSTAVRARETACKLTRAPAWLDIWDVNMTFGWKQREGISFFDSFLTWFRSWRSVEYIWWKCMQAIQGFLLGGHKSPPVKHKHVLSPPAKLPLITEDLPGWAPVGVYFDNQFNSSGLVGWAAVPSSANLARLGHFLPASQAGFRVRLFL